MITIIGSIVGFITSLLPEILEHFKNEQRNRHQLEILDKQYRLTKVENEGEVTKLNLYHDMREMENLYKHANKSSKIAWIEGLRASVRPMITYVFFISFILVKLVVLTVMIQADNADILTVLQSVWDSETQALFATVVSFWFGQRAFLRFRNSKESHQ